MTTLACPLSFALDIRLSKELCDCCRKTFGAERSRMSSERSCDEYATARCATINVAITESFIREPLLAFAEESGSLRVLNVCC